MFTRQSLTSKGKDNNSDRFNALIRRTQDSFIKDLTKIARGEGEKLSMKMVSDNISTDLDSKIYNNTNVFVKTTSKIIKMSDLGKIRSNLTNYCVSRAFRVDGNLSRHVIVTIYDLD